jgi:hypothetical protein
MLTCLIFAMGAYEGGAHVLFMPPMPYSGRAARVPTRLYAYMLFIVHWPQKLPLNFLLHGSLTVLDYVKPGS